MPHISTAMQRSLQHGLGNILSTSLLGRRDIIGQASDVKNTFSSWDNCMAQSYCKWPVIIAIIVVSLIIFSIITCIIRCACLGYSCCCACFSCLKCCDCCGDSCAGKKNKPMKHLDERSYGHSSRTQGYQAPAPMMGGGLASKPDAPRYAQFEVGKNGLAVSPKPALSEDALPPMPSWDTAGKRHVLDEEEKNAVELGELDPATGQRIPLISSDNSAAKPSVTRTPSRERIPSPFGVRPAPSTQNSYSSNTDPYTQKQLGFAAPGRAYNGSPSPDRYRESERGYREPTTQERTYSPDVYGSDRGYGRTSPQHLYTPQAGHPIDDNLSGASHNRSRLEHQYPNDERSFTPQVTGGYSNNAVRSQNTERRYPDRSYPGQAFDNFQPNSSQHGSYGEPTGVSRNAPSPLQNNSGFDFGGGDSYRSRPIQQQNNYEPMDSNYYSGAQHHTANQSYPENTTMPQPFSSQGPRQEPSYPAYRPQRTMNGGRGAPSSAHDREPPRWSPVEQ